MLPSKGDWKYSGTTFRHFAKINTNILVPFPNANRNLRFNQETRANVWQNFPAETITTAAKSKLEFKNNEILPHFIEKSLEVHQTHSPSRNTYPCTLCYHTHPAIWIINHLLNENLHNVFIMQYLKVANNLLVVNNSSWKFLCEIKK